MTNVQFVKHNGSYVGVVCEGHADYADFGEDIVCASISAIVGSTYLGLTQVLGIKAKITRRDDDGYVEIRLPKNISDDKLKDAQIIFETMKVSLLDICKGYPKNINVEV